MSAPLSLSIRNAHPRDEHISFEEGPHIYTVLGERGTYKSVTTWNHSHFEEFDGEAIVERILKGSRWANDPTYKYYKKSKETILGEWEINRVAASGAGTKMHFDIEMFYNDVPVENDSIEFKFFHDFRRDFPELVPYRTEWMVYYEELKLSGSIDMVFFDTAKQEYLIYDWKRSKEIVFDNVYGRHAKTACISHLPDTNFWHYSLQLNTYKMILQDKYGLKIGGMFLVVLHPNQNTYARIPCSDLTPELALLKEVRLQEVQRLLAAVEPSVPLEQPAASSVEPVVEPSEPAVQPLEPSVQPAVEPPNNIKSCIY
jgi:hypothetical protein